MPILFLCHSFTYTSKPMRIIFMGNPDFAVPSLEKVHERFGVVAVVTGPDRLGGRGRKEVIESSVKKAAYRLGIPVLQPEKFRDEAFLGKLKSYNADIQIVVAFRMLPEVVWDMPPQGTINLHASLLPAYRGAAPIQWAIINGEVKTGLTTFKLKHEIDTGDIMLSEELAIGPDDTAGDLHDRMSEAGGELICRTIDLIDQGKMVASPQSSAKVSLAPKIFFEDTKIDPDLSVKKVHDFVRGMSPYPGAWFEFGELTLKIIKGVPLSYKRSIENGQWISDRKSFLGLACRDGIYRCKSVQLSGKRVMEVTDFLNGYSRDFSHIECHDIFKDFD